MSGAIYGGDEVGALVLEVGSYMTKGGYAGEDCPSCTFPTAMGSIVPSSEGGDVEMKDASAPQPIKGKRSFRIGTMAMTVPRPNMEVISPIRDGAIVDWDAYEATLDHVFDSLHCSPSEHPIMVTDEAWSAREQREKLTELIFEKYQVPAYFLARKAVLSAFAHGKATALVFDMGAGGCSAVPVYDGYVLQKGVQRSRLGGGVLVDLYRDALTAEKVELVPRFMIAKKGSREDQKAIRKYKLKKLSDITESYKDECTKQEVRDFIESVAQVSETPYDETKLQGLPTVQYEFSTGYDHSFGTLRQRVPEALFSPKSYVSPRGREILDIRDPMYGLGASQLVSASIEGCDVDVRSMLYANMAVTGGSTLLPGFVERLSNDVSALAPAGTKVTLLRASSNERRFSSWIGGSILASLGTFQQMWISRHEYDEAGRGLVEKKCA
eukprot:comp19398_c0_seq1/m.22443 comp19398_c0_seq1/g.22443  ORF comp19398_c0_seq1/g.22443 comp19398_c0_seq1/m.22443 type:complete len:439 (-) comp19398_c0_seq1:635-1951(-)